MGLNTLYHAPDGQTSLMDQMKGLTAAKQVDFCLYRLGEIGEMAEAPKVGDYWPAFRLHEPAALQMPAVAERLAAEVRALERMKTMGCHAMTVRGKLWIYQIVIDLLLDDSRDPAETNRLCTWEDFKKLFAKEVATMCDEDAEWQAEIAKKMEEARQNGAGATGAAGPAGMGGAEDRGRAGQADEDTVSMS